LMHHWLIRPRGVGADNHRWHWEDHLTPRLVGGLTAEQREVLMLGEQFEIDPAYDREREMRAAAPKKVVWGTLDELGGGGSSSKL
jgi:hypothetical protein